jgi:hypothetical protein
VIEEAFQFPSGIAAIARKAILFGVLVDMVVIAVTATSVDSPLRMPGGAVYFAEATVPILVYGLIFFQTPGIRLVRRQRALHVGTIAGAIGGILQIAHMALENYGDRIGENSIVTLTFMGSAFLIWGFSGYYVTRETRDIKAGIVASCWSAMVSVLMAVTFGLALMTASIPSAAYVATWPEFKQSGWADARAFAIANTFEAVLSHLVVGPIAGLIFGVLGIGVAKLRPIKQSEKEA